MELSFNVACGPISQVALPLLDVKTAVQLAVGAYGWWKARERTITLVDMVQAVGGQLAPSPTFDLSRYQAARRTTEVRGIAWYDGRLEAVPLPRASTGNWGDLGLICLRAVTTALLAVYNVDATTAVLTHIIPKRLINYDVDDRIRAADGPFVACMKQFVESVATEEEANTLRRDLWRLLDATLDETLSVSHFKFRPEDVQEIEVPIVIGLLDWVLTSPHKRFKPIYLTRSLTAWSLAILLSYLGFEIRASRAVAQADVYLITYPGGQTDLLAPTPDFSNPTRAVSTHRIVPIRAIPLVIFRHICYRYACPKIEVTRLCEIWDRAFERASSLFGPVRLTERGAIQLPVSQDGSNQADHPLFDVLRPLLTMYLPHLKWDGDGFKSQYFKLSKYNDSQDWKHVEEFYIFAAITLATTYAACCCSLCEISADMFVEVAVDENMLSGPRKTIPFSLELFNATSHVDDVITSGGWTSWQLNILTGCCDEESMTNVPYDAFGYYKNGIFVIADLMIRPSIFPESLVRFHIQHGQPLQLPVSENGFILAAGQDPMMRSEPLPIENLPAIDVLQTQKSNNNLRIDLEPHWEENPRKVIFRVRCQGLLKCSFSPERLARAFLNVEECDGLLESQIVGCKYEQDAFHEDGHGHCEVPISSGEWRSMEISQLVNIYSPNVLFRAPEEFSVCIRAGGDIPSQVLCLICLEPPVTIAFRCLKCAYAAVTSQPTDVDQHILRGTKAKRMGCIIVDGLEPNLS